MVVPRPAGAAERQGCGGAVADLYYYSQWALQHSHRKHATNFIRLNQTIESIKKTTNTEFLPQGSIGT
jgi:hypothetical protein